LLDSLKDEKKATLAVADKNLANAINKLPGLDLKLIADSSTDDLFRAIREHLPALLPGLKPEELTTTSLGLSHSLSRHKLKFSADKVDTMIIQAIGLLDDLDKELNMYAMRVKEWYGWHFPEMARIINDNLAYSRIVMKMGMRENAKESDLSEILPEEIEIAVKAAAEVSMGTEITPEDLDKIQLLAEQVVSFTEYRSQLSSYLSSRMQAIAPNLTTIVGELVGARLIQHAGSLSSLAKNPASTIQILGSEKALFRALKTKHDTPKYGLIYHASLVGQASGKNKGKIARVLAAKAALGVRVDSLSEWGADQEQEDGEEPTEEERAALGLRARAYVERRLRALEGRSLTQKGAAVGPSGSLAAQPSKFSIKEARKYNPDADGLAGNEEPSTAPTPSKPAKPAKSSKPLIQEVPEVAMTNGQATAGAQASDSDEDSDEEEEAPVTNGKADGATDKASRKAEKAARKAARAEKRRLKEEKRAKKEKKAKKEAADAKATATEPKKRKRDDGEEKVEKKKKKKQKSEA
jgi:nucleolar protein 58